MIIQIYGILTSEDAARVAGLGADHIGVVVGEHGRTPDEVNFATARAILAAVLASTVKVALTIATDLDEIEQMVRAVHPDILHLASDLDAPDLEEMRALRRRLPDLPLMRSIPVAGPDAVGAALRFEDISDYLLLDTKDPKTHLVGASGRTHDWTISRQIVERVRIPVMLAGGLSPENVAEAIRIVRPWGVDSQTQTNRPGLPIRKDPERVRRFIENARRAARN
jgi:phosphoribosylanthranilate isomerase